MIESKLLTTIAPYVDGTWLTSSQAESSEVTNPATGKPLATVPMMSADSITRAIEAADKASNESPSLEQRQRWLNELAQQIREHRDVLGRIITQEHGKPLPEAIGEADYAAEFFAWFAGQLGEVQSRVVVATPREHSWTVHYRPASVAALISPWNFPLAMMAKKLSAALAAGCTAVVKPSSKTPLSMIALFRLLDTLDMPRGMVNLVLGKSSLIGDAFCSHPAVRVISFTGSTRVGKELASTAAPHLKRLALELGGNAPFIIFEDADIEAAVDAFVANKFRGGGQTCVCANRLYVHKGIASKLKEALVARVANMTLGNGLDDGVDLGPLIDRKAREGVAAYVRDALAKGAQLLHGDPDEIPRSLPDTGTWFPPIVLDGITREMACANEETFGPVAAILEFDDEASVIEEANRTEYGLAAYFFTADSGRAERCVERLQFGHVGWNSGTGPTPEAPFGGMKHSGFGREGGIEGLHDFIEPQTIARPLSDTRTSSDPA